MSWYAAHAIMYFQLADGPQDDFRVYENIYLIEADTPKGAWAKACDLARREEGADRVEIENPTLSSSFQWKAVGLVADTAEGLLFCNQARQVVFWLPERVLVSDQLRERALALIRKSGVNICRLW